MNGFSLFVPGLGDAFDELQNDVATVVQAVSEMESPSFGSPAWEDITDKPADFPPSSHTHGGVYSPVGHDHAGVYAAAAHNHDASYSATGHNHDGAYAPVSSVPNASYRSLLDCTGSHIAGRGANTYWLGQGQAAGVTGTGTLYAPNLLYIDSADYPTLNGVAAKLRLRVQVYCNDVAPFVGTFTFGLRPVTRPGTAGGAGLNIYTIGAAVAGSTVVLTNPVADSMNVLVGSDFALPANGHYVLGFTTSASMATSSHAHISAILQMRNA